jgi:hypothetical protein
MLFVWISRRYGYGYLEGEMRANEWDRLPFQILSGEPGNKRKDWVGLTSEIIGAALILE